MDKQVSRQYFNNRAAHWDETERSNAPAQLQAMAVKLDFPPDAQVMDVGTGTGIFVPYIRSKLNGDGRVVCVDYAFQMLEIALEKNGNSRVEYVCAEIETVGFRAGIFDAVVCYSTFPHFHDKPLALRTIFALLRPSGQVFICHTASWEFINDIHRGIPDFTDHLIPPNDEMRAMMGAVGFTDIDIDEDETYYLASGTKK